MSGTKTDPHAAAREAARTKAVAAHKAAVDAQKAVVVEPVMVGYDETQPHQTEVVVGSVEHVTLLSSYPNATTYGPDVNVVAPEPPVEPPPPEGSGDPQMRTPVGTTLSKNDEPDSKSKK